jgi:large subunit ribosomal protein L24
MAAKIRKGDTVEVMRGKDRGKRGTVQQVFMTDRRLMVEGLNMVVKHVKPNPRLRQAGRITSEMPLPIANVRYVCNKCTKAVRVGFQLLDDGTKVRMCKHCGESVE